MISVIIPVKNGARFLEEALRSVLQQTLPPGEVLVVDAGSTDGSRAIVQRYAPEGVRLVEQAGTGIAAAWNQGIAATRGEYLAFLSSDDRWRPGKLALQEAALQEDPTLEYVNTHFEYFLEPGCAIPPTFNRALLGRPLVGRIMETLVARRAAFARIGGFDEAFRTAEDVDWYARAQDAGLHSAVLPEVLLDKRVHDDNLSASGALNTPHLLEALRRSVRRRRGDG